MMEAHLSVTLKSLFFLFLLLFLFLFLFFFLVLVFVVVLLLLSIFVSSSCSFVSSDCYDYYVAFAVAVAVQELTAMNRKLRN